jgi:uncharacterized protein YukE
MSRSTQLDPAEIHKQANNHDQTRENIVGQLDQLKVDVQNVLAASGSAATRALSTSTDSWVESVKKTVISHMEQMSTNIRREADGQEATDEELHQAILNIPIETGNFLGGR